MPRGGRRPGAGAPRGKLNALKTGKYSRRVRGFYEALASHPETREILRRLTARGGDARLRARPERLAASARFFGPNGSPEVQMPEELLRQLVYARRLRERMRAVRIMIERHLAAQQLARERSAAMALAGLETITGSEEK